MRVLLLQFISISKNSGFIGSIKMVNGINAVGLLFLPKIVSTNHWSSPSRELMINRCTLNSKNVNILCFTILIFSFNEGFSRMLSLTSIYRALNDTTPQKILISLDRENDRLKAWSQKNICVERQWGMDHFKAAIEKLLMS